MNTSPDLYIELKPDIAAIANQLFDFSELCLKKRNNFLPHAAVLSEEGEVKLVAAVSESESDNTNSIEVLPVLHDGLRLKAKRESLRAIGVAENVTISPNGKPSTKAIKVLFEHKRGLTVALYLPFNKTYLNGYVFGAPFSLAAKPEINAWS